jgi:hypothetical protein
MLVEAGVVDNSAIGSVVAADSNQMAQCASRDGSITIEARRE